MMQMMPDYDVSFPDTLEKAAAGIALDQEAMQPVLPHEHSKTELIYLISGNLTVQADKGIWVVPPGRALWIPAGSVHSSFETGSIVARCFFFEPNLSNELPTECRIVFVHPLLHFLLDRLIELRLETDRSSKREDRLVAVLLDELFAAPSEPFNLLFPQDPRLRKIANFLIDEPSLKIAITGWCSRVGLSPRSLSRLFRKDVGMSLGKWRQSLHVQIALRELERGSSVSAIAYDLGYDSPSAFIAMFKRNTGQTPGALHGPAVRPH